MGHRRCASRCPRRSRSQDHHGCVRFTRVRRDVVDRRPQPAGVDATRLAQEIAGQGVTITGATFTGDPRQGGLFSGPGVVDAIGVTDGVVMSSGIVGDVVGPNDEPGKGEDFDRVGDAGLNALVAPRTTFDAAVLEMTFVPTSPDLQINYVFASEEYHGVRRHPVQRRVRVLGQWRRHGQQLRHRGRPWRPRAGHDQHDQPPAQHADLRRQPRPGAIRHPVRRLHPAADLLRDREPERPEHARGWRSPTPATGSWMPRCSWSRRVSRRPRRRGIRR